MSYAWRVLSSWSEPVTRRVYLCAGLVLTALKFGVDNAIVWFADGEVWNPLAYLPSLVLKEELTVGPVSNTTLMLLAVNAAVFLWPGVTLTIRRYVDAGFSPWFGLLFFVPFVNLVVMLVGALLPTKHASSGIEFSDGPYRGGRAQKPTPQLLQSPQLRLVVVSMSGTMLLVATMILGIFAFEGYGWGLFYLGPFVSGAVVAALANRGQLRGLRYTLGLCALSVLLAAGAALLFAVEGLICILMAAPLALIGVAIGGAVGYAIVSAGRPPRAAELLVLLAMVPATMAFDLTREPILHEVVTSIEIDAPPEQVWEHVVAFSELDEPAEWFFKLGIAYPQRARIDGEGVGAVRHCEFSTGPFVEPITVWEPPYRLGFDVQSQPPSMKELSPYRFLNAPHLEGYMQSKRGEFRLQRLPGDRTRLEGSTWYTLSIFPERYWIVYAEWLLHAIHTRVLQQVERETLVHVATHS